MKAWSISFDALTVVADSREQAIEKARRAIGNGKGDISYANPDEVVE